MPIAQLADSLSSQHFTDITGYCTNLYSYLSPLYSTFLQYTIVVYGLLVDGNAELSLLYTRHHNQNRNRDSNCNCFHRVSVTLSERFVPHNTTPPTATIPAITAVRP
jgi:hypothetical protein